MWSLKAKVNPAHEVGCTGMSNEGKQGSSLPLVDVTSIETVSSTSNCDSTCPPRSPPPTYCWCGGENGRMITCDIISVVQESGFISCVLD